MPLLGRGRRSALGFDPAEALQHDYRMKIAPVPLRVLAGLLLVSLNLAAQKTPVPEARLESGDIEHFLETYPKMVSQLKALGKKYEGLEDPTNMQAVVANKEVRDILERYDWTTESFLSKLTTIASAFGAARVQAEMANLPAEQRAMIESMMGSQMPDLMTVHPDDLARVKKHMKRLQALFDSQ